MRKPCMSHKSIAGLEKLMHKASAIDTEEIAAAGYIQKLINYYRSDTAQQKREAVARAKLKGQS